MCVEQLFKVEVSSSLLKKNVLWTFTQPLSKCWPHKWKC